MLPARAGSHEVSSFAIASPSGVFPARIALGGLDEVGGREDAGDPVQLVPGRVEEEDGREGADGVALGEAPPLPLLRVDFRGDDVLAGPRADGRVGEGHPVELLARTAPDRVGVDHDGLLLGARATQHLGERSPFGEGDALCTGPPGGWDGGGEGEGREEGETAHGAGCKHGPFPGVKHAGRAAESRPAAQNAGLSGWGGTASGSPG